VGRVDEQPGGCVSGDVNCGLRVHSVLEMVILWGSVFFVLLVDLLVENTFRLVFWLFGFFGNWLSEEVV
jgi:hypothetical protein